MSRLVREEKKPRSPYAPRLTPEQEKARVAQSKADRKRIVLGIVRRASPVTRNGLPIWGGLQPRRFGSKPVGEVAA